MTVDHLLDQQLSFPARVGHVALLLAALAMTVVCAALIASEEGLPLRTVVALSALCAIGLSWAGYAVWTLRHRQPLLAGHQVIAAKIGITASLVFTAGAFAVYALANVDAGLLAGLGGASLAAVGLLLHQRSKQHLTALKRRKEELAAELG